VVVRVTVTPTTITFTGSGVVLAADRWEADGPHRHGVVVLLHGGGQTRHSWRKTGARLSAAGWAAITIDSRGHGDSDWPPEADYGHDALGRDLGAIVEQLGEKPVIVGASMGGLTALIAEGNHPGLARALVLVDIVPRIEQQGSDEIVSFMRSGVDGFASLEEAADAVAAYTPNRPRPGNPEGLRKNLRLRDGRWYWHWDPRMIGRSDGLPTADFWYDEAVDAATKVRVPTMLVRGAQSAIVSDAGVEELLRLIPHAEYVDVADAAHMIAGDNNDVFAERLVEFLDRRVR
jgi:pimeloyl-ACP methyl ester carboxylesterase